MISLKPGAPFLLALSLTLGSLPAVAAELRILQLERITPSAAVQPQGRASGAIASRRLRFEAWSRNFELLLEHNASLLPGGTPSGGPEPLRGTVAGNSGSWVRLTYSAGRYTGVFFDGVQLYAIEPAAAAARSSAVAAAMDPAATVIYRLADTQITGALFEGDTVSTTRNGAETFDQIAAELPPATAAAVLATRRLDVGVVVDPELAQVDGTDTQANVVARMNLVDGIFAEQVGVHLQLLSTTILDSASPPFSSNDPSTLLEELSAYRRTSAVQQGNGLTHLMTGRSLDGQTVGIAYLSSICNDRFAASLSEARNSVNLDALVAAHEIGHTFGAPHDGDTDADAPACAAAAPPGFLMAPLLNGSSTFSDCSLQEIAKKVATASCLAPIDAADAALGASLSADLALNQATTVAFNVRSVGNVAVNNVIVEVNLPATVIASGAGAEAGTCDVAPNRIVCNLGSLPPGQSRAIEMSLLGSSSGQSDAALSMTATNDGLAQNNNSTLRLNTSAGADLTVSVVSPELDVIVGQTSTATITLRNLGLADAADAQLTALFPTGLVPTSLTATGISCTLEAAGITCPAGQLEAAAEASLVVGVRGTAAGNQRLTVSLRSSRPDPQPGNNEAGITFRVAAAPPPANASGGGGSLGLSLLLWLAALGWLRHGWLARARWLTMLLLGSGLVGSCFPPAWAGSVTVQVKDAAGQAVPDAVVVLEALSGASSPTMTARPTATVDQRNLRFVPEISVVRTGTAIDFPNSDKVLHQVYSFSPARNFKLSLYAGHVHPPLVFDAAGIVTLGCNIHDAMIGFIYVTDSPWFGKTDATGRYQVEQLSAGNYRVLIWHPRFSEATPQLESTLAVPTEGAVPLIRTLTRPMKPATTDNSTRQWKGY